jgi:hypothetical protein
MSNAQAKAKFLEPAHEALARPEPSYSGSVCRNERRSATMFSIPVFFVLTVAFAAALFSQPQLRPTKIKPHDRR